MDEKLTHLDLFSGIGGFSFAFEAEGFRTVAFAETDSAASSVLKYHWPGVPNLGDVTKIDYVIFKQEHGTPDVVTGGYPCQPASLLGARRGTADERWLWPEAFRVARELRPRFMLAENPPSLLTLERGTAFNGIVSGLAALRYDCWWDVVPAAAVGAGHLRERLFIVAADANRLIVKERAGLCAGGQEGERWRRPENQIAENHAEPAAHGNDAGLEGHAGNEAGSGKRRERGTGKAGPVAPPLVRTLASENWLETESPVAPLVYGLPGGLVEAAVRCVGNSIIPQIAQIYAKSIMKCLRDE